MSKESESTTHFGYQTVPEGEKARKVGAVFHSVARRYDLMNDLMSAGLHRAWKRYAVDISGVKVGDRVLDVAGGSGDLSRLFASRVGPSGEVVLTDINASMLCCSATPKNCPFPTTISTVYAWPSACAT